MNCSPLARSLETYLTSSSSRSSMNSARVGNRHSQRMASSPGSCITPKCSRIFGCRRRLAVFNSSNAASTQAWSWPPDASSSWDDTNFTLSSTPLDEEPRRPRDRATLSFVLSVAPAVSGPASSLTGKNTDSTVTGARRHKASRRSITSSTARGFSISHASSSTSTRSSGGRKVVGATVTFVEAAALSTNASSRRISASLLSHKVCAAAIFLSHSDFTSEIPASARLARSSPSFTTRARPSALVFSAFMRSW
mmetsp:Transcript_56549/g.121416  ORF Transcript_56549/g.121416 Transcript_56549/m.121416 type:complete len:252 (-) Transcript_56549:1111-1866(-)